MKQRQFDNRGGQSNKYLQQAKRWAQALPLVLLILLGLGSTAAAQTTYTSVQSGNWNNPLTWSPSGVPGTTAGDNVVINPTHTVTINISPANPLGNITINGGVLLWQAGASHSITARNVTVNSGGQFGVQTPSGNTATHTLTLSPLPTDPPNTPTVFSNAGIVGFNQFFSSTDFNVCNVVFTRTDAGQQQLIGSGGYILRNLTMQNTFATLLPSLNVTSNPSPPPVFTFDDAAQTAREQWIGAPSDPISPPILINGDLTINNRGGQTRGVIVFGGDYKEDNATRIYRNLTIFGNVDLQHGVLIWNARPNGTLTHTVAGNISIGSGTSSVLYSIAIPRRSAVNTGMVLSSADNAVTTLTVSGNITAPDLTDVFTDPSGFVADEGISLVLTSPLATNNSGATLTVNGNFNTGSGASGASLLLAGNGYNPLTFPFAPPTGIIRFNFNGNFSVKATSRYNGLRSGFTNSVPIISFGGGTALTPAIIDAPREVWLGSIGETNLITNWQIASGAFRRLIATPTYPSTIAVMNGYSLTVNGTLICDDGAELIASWTASTPPPSSLNSTLVINGVIRVADVDGLGDGTSLNPSSNFPLFIRRDSPNSPSPNGWDLTSINTSGTIDYNNAVATQAITPRNETSAFAPNVRYHNLVISGLDKTLAGGSVVVGNQLTLSGGIVNVGASDTVRVLSTAPALVTRTSGHINGRLERLTNGIGNNYLFPIGDNDDYRPITLNGVTSTNALIAFRHIESGPKSLGGTFPPPPGEVSDVRYWQGELVSGTFTSATSFSLAYGPNDFVLTGGTSVVGAHRSSTVAGAYNNFGQSAPVPAGSGTLTSASFPTGAFSTVGQQEFFTLGTLNPTDNPLPVELVEFVGRATGLGVELRWKTASELSNAGFLVLRNGEVVAHYREVEALRGAGTSTVGRSYRYVDASVREGERYVYELRSVDFDGTVHSYAMRVEVVGQRVSREFRLEQNYPNPFNPSTTIRYTLPVASEVSLRVYDMLGRVVGEVLRSAKQEAGTYEVRFDAQGLSSGVYLYRLEATSAQGRFVESKKMVLMK